MVHHCSLCIEGGSRLLMQTAEEEGHRNDAPGTSPASKVPDLRRTQSNLALAVLHAAVDVRETAELTLKHAAERP
jgi:hypothetical protein